MTIALARLAAGEVVLPADAAEPIVFAAAELGSYAGRMFGTPPRRRAAPGPPGDWLALVPRGAPAPDPAPLPAAHEWTARPAGAGAVVRGTSARAVLAGVYGLLAAAGCRWSPHGEAEEHVPGRGEALEVIPALGEQPRFLRRAYAADLATWHYTMPDRLAERLPGDRAFVDWMAKSGATGFLFIRHANDTRWVVPELVPELRRRGLALEGGGHALVELLPRALFAAHPEYFPLGARGRSDFGNVCVANREALAIVRERAGVARAETPGGDLHLWGLDLLGGGWCACAGCAALTPSDQALVVCNAVAEAVEGDARVFHLAYHDTIRPPAQVRPHPRVSAEFAPRERCYAHALDDPGCPTNPSYRRALEEHLERFDGRVDVFEYYGDAILFGGCAVPLVAVIERDLDYYHRVGVRGLSCLVFGQYSLWAYGVNVEAFARGALRPGAGANARAAYCARRYAAAAAPMAGYLVALERALAEVVRWGDVLLPPTSAAGTARAALSATLGAGPALRTFLAEARGAAGASTLLAAEERLLDYTLDVLAALADWLDALPVADAGERALAALFDAVRHVRAVEPRIAGTWGAYDLEITHAFFAAALRARRD